jgi:hypothetical protein
MDIIQKRFDELSAMADKIISSMSTSERHMEITPRRRSLAQLQRDNPSVRTYTEQSMDAALAIEWQTSVLSLLTRVFGVDSPTCSQFQQLADARRGTDHQRFSLLLAIFKSAKSDYEGGYLFNIRSLVHAEVFADELEQAAHFLDSGGYKVPAAVIAGTVLEVTLRNLCDQRPNLSKDGSLNKMNDDLAKDGAYNKMRADQIRAWAKIRNAAAHGQPDEFEASDVTRMIEGIRDFVAANVN